MTSLGAGSDLPTPEGRLHDGRQGVAREAIRLCDESLPATRVLVIEAHPLVRVGISGVLRGAGFEVVDAPSPGAAASMRHVRADVVVMGVDPPNGSGDEAVRLMAAAMPQARAVVLVEHADDPGVIGALRAGACGAILRQAATHEIVPAIRAAAEGESALSPPIASRLVRQLRLRDQGTSSHHDLTPRELDVLRLLSRGWDNPRIAAALYVGRGTVKHHIATIFDKLGVDNRIQAAVKAVQLGLVDG